MTPPFPLELSTQIGWNSWKNGCQNSVTIHHCFNEPGATVAKEGRKTMLLRCSSAFKFPFVNYSLVRGHNDHQNVSKFSPYRVGQFVTKTGPIYTCICELLLKGRVFLIELNSVIWDWFWLPREFYFYEIFHDVLKRQENCMMCSSSGNLLSNFQEDHPILCSRRILVIKYMALQA